MVKSAPITNGLKPASKKASPIKKAPKKKLGKKSAPRKPISKVPAIKKSSGSSSNPQPKQMWDYFELDAKYKKL
jgi:hypothetical protein